MDNRLQNEKEKAVRKFSLSTVLLALLLLLAACSSSPAAPTGVAVTDEAPAVTDDATSDDGSDGQVNADGDVGVDMQIPSAKPEEEQTQDMIDQVVADGTYAQQRTYNYHSGSETVDISITVENDVVTAASVTGNDPNPVSAKYINGVNDALGELVVGKRIDQLEIPDQVSGSSLTTGAFKQYVEDIIEQY